MSGKMANTKRAMDKGHCGEISEHLEAKAQKHENWR